MILTIKLIKVYNIFFLLCLFILQIAMANDEAPTSSQIAPYKITHTPIIKLLKAVNNVSEYTMSHLDYFADECKCTVINKYSFFSILLVNYLLSSCFDIENSDVLLYSACALLSISLLFSGCNTLITPNELIQRLSILFYGFYKYIFPIYSLAIISNSYTAKLGRNGYIPTFLFSLATIRSFILSNDDDDPFTESIPLLVINNHLPVTPKMKLMRKILIDENTKNDLYVYTGPLTLHDKDNLMSKLYKWTALHTDDISLGLFSNILVNNALQRPEIDEIKKINETIEDLNNNKIKKEDIMNSSFAIHPFYDDQLFLENCSQLNTIGEKCQNYNVVILDTNKTLLLTYKDLTLSFIKLKVPAIDSNSLIDILNLHKAITVESVKLSFAIHETILNNQYQYFSILKNKGIYYLFLSLNAQNKNNFNFKAINNILKMSAWSLLSGINCFHLKNCLIIKINNINSLREILTNAIDTISYTTGEINIYTSLSNEDMEKKYFSKKNKQNNKG